MKPFLVALAIAVAAIILIKPLRIQAKVVALEMGFLEQLYCVDSFQVYTSVRCEYQFNLLGPIKKMESVRLP